MAWATAAILAYYAMTYAGYYYSLGEHSALARFPAWIRVLLSIGVSLTVWHFFLDRALFRMRDPATRRIVGPLLVSNG